MVCLLHSYRRITEGNVFILSPTREGVPISIPLHFNKSPVISGVYPSVSHDTSTSRMSFLLSTQSTSYNTSPSPMSFLGDTPVTGPRFLPGGYKVPGRGYPSSRQEVSQGYPMPSQDRIGYTWPGQDGAHLLAITGWSTPPPYWPGIPTLEMEQHSEYLLCGGYGSCIYTGVLSCYETENAYISYSFWFSGLRGCWERAATLDFA